MNKPTQLFVTACLLLTTINASAQKTVSLVRQDQQVLHVSAYSPKGATCLGVAIISPGAGGSEQGYSYLGEAMSALGYLAVVVGHQESGRRALREHMRDNGLREGLSALITDPDAYRARFMDIAATKAWASSQCQSPETILIGHSMGAATTMMMAGAKNKLGLTGTDSFHAYVALSPQGVGAIFPHNAWENIKRPMLLLTGTRDNDLAGASWKTRTEPYLNMPAGCKWLAVIEGATHMSFAGRDTSGHIEALTLQTIRSFLDGIERRDCKTTQTNQGIDIKTK